jgi:flagellar P-ring protein precursor FlgI
MVCEYHKNRLTDALKEGRVTAECLQMKTTKQSMVFAHVASLLLMLALALFTNVAEATRIKDLASIQGVRENYLVGYGLVVGLDGTGDSADFTGQSLRSLLSHYGIKLPPNVNPKSQNVAAVMVHANLPPFIKQGQTVDITVSALGSSKSLRGGSLLMTPLKGIDGQIYAIAQGNLGETLTLNLHTPDFTTARRMAEVINETLGPDTATASDAVSVSVLAPKDANQRVSFMSFLENLTFEPGEPAAKIIVNARTGTIVIGNHVEVLPAAVTHGSLVVTIAAKQEVSQPEPFTDGETTVTTQTDIQVSQSSGPMFLFEPGVQLQDIVRAVNQVGAAPGDLIAILEALRGAGALRAELIVI